MKTRQMGEVASNAVSPAMVMIWIWLCLIPIIICDSDSFSVSVPQAQVSGLLGGTTTLICTLTKNLNATDLEVHWYRPTKDDTSVLLYKNRQVLESKVDPQYKGRVSLVGDIKKGNVSLELKNIKMDDRGMYMCHVSSKNWYDKASLSLDLRAVGSIPVLSMSEVEEGRVKVSCESRGWLPKPSINWKDSEGRDLKLLNQKSTPDSNGLLSVSSWLVVPPSESEWLSCSVGLSASQEWRESRVLPHTPTDSESAHGWKGAFIAILVLWLLCIVGIVVLLQRKGLLGSKRKRTEHIEETELKNGTELENQSLLCTNKDHHTETKVNIAPAADQMKSSDKLVNSATRKNPAVAADKPLSLPPVKEDEQKRNTPPNQNVLTETNSPHSHPEHEGEQNKSQAPVQPHLTESTGPDQLKSTESSGANSVPETNSLHSHPEHEEEQNKSQPPVQPHLTESTNPDQLKSTESSGAIPPPESSQNLQHENTEDPTYTPADLDQVTQYKVKITIHPEETPAVLHRTHEGKRVICRHLQKDPDHEEYKIFTLCKEHFSSGKHYWEVKVGGRPQQKLSWYVGVASDTAERKHNVPLVPKNGFWVLGYEKEKGVYIKDHPVPVPLPDASETLTCVGVFLDCNQHTLSFYNVDVKLHLYTFNGVKAKGSLYPLISPGLRDKHPVNIC